MALRLHHRLAFGHIAYFAAIASAFQPHGILPCLVARHFDASGDALAISFCFTLISRHPKKERGPNLRWSPSTVRALPGMCPNRSSGRDLVRSRPGRELTCCKRAKSEE